MLYRGARRKETTPSMLGFHISPTKYPPSMFSSSTSKRIKTETLVSQALCHFRSMTFPPVSSSCFSFLPEPSSEQPLHLNPIQVLFRDAEVLLRRPTLSAKLSSFLLASSEFPLIVHAWWCGPFLVPRTLLAPTCCYVAIRESGENLLRFSCGGSTLCDDFYKVIIPFMKMWQHDLITPLKGVSGS